MVPRADIRGVPESAGLRAVVRPCGAAGHSRLVVYRGSLDDVLGMVNVKDLLGFWGDGDGFTLDQAMRPVLIVPPSMRVLELLLEMRDKRHQMAVVVDEFGGTDGLVTLEDLVEEIVGELQDEHERARPPQLVRMPTAPSTSMPGSISRIWRRRWASACSRRTSGTRPTRWAG